MTLPAASRDFDELGLFEIGKQRDLSEHGDGLVKLSLTRNIEGDRGFVRSSGSRRAVVGVPRHRGSIARSAHVLREACNARKAPRLVGTPAAGVSRNAELRVIGLVPSVSWPLIASPTLRPRWHTAMYSLPTTLRAASSTPIRMTSKRASSWRSRSRARARPSTRCRRSTSSRRGSTQTAASRIVCGRIPTRSSPES